ncbi:MAG: hypothetical protein P8N02_06205 [Actinomycetota bacterium]|jgi:hypothetical protein|nr:hypothetical protein [Actinomycetota bacterium]
MSGGNEKIAAAFQERLDSAGRVILELPVQDWITYDGAKVMGHVTGAWEPGEPWEDPRL